MKHSKYRFAKESAEIWTREHISDELVRLMRKDIFSMYKDKKYYKTYKVFLKYLRKRDLNMWHRLVDKE